MGSVSVSSPVFVVAPGPVVLFFRTSSEVVRDLRRMDADERDAAAFFALSGEVLSLVAANGDVRLEASGEHALGTLQTALGAVANDPDAATDPTKVANEILRDQWHRRWPRHPHWLHRRVRGAEPPTV